MSWIERDEKWLAGRVPRPERPAVPVEVAVQDPEAGEPDAYGITINVLKCPRIACRSDDVKLYKSFPWEGSTRKKYYRCNTCGYRFRVTELNKD